MERLSRCSREDHTRDNQGRLGSHHDVAKRNRAKDEAMKMATALKGLALVLRFQADDGASIRWVEKRLRQLSRKAEHLGGLHDSEAGEITG